MTKAEIQRDALMRIANTYGVLAGADYGETLREFAEAALSCDTEEEYEALLDGPPPGRGRVAE